jgi:hypothetical protein
MSKCEVMEQALIITTTALLLVSQGDSEKPARTPAAIANDAFIKLNALKNGGFG